MPHFSSCILQFKMGSGVSKNATNFEVCTEVFQDFHAITVAESITNEIGVWIFLLFVCVVGDDSSFQPVMHCTNAIRFYGRRDKTFMFCSNPMNGNREEIMEDVQNTVNELFLSAQGSAFALRISVHYTNVMFSNQNGNLRIRDLPRPLYEEFKEDKNVVVYGPDCIFAMQGNLQIMRDHFVRVYYPKWALSPRHVIRIFKRGQRGSTLFNLLEKKGRKIRNMLVLDDQLIVANLVRNLVNKEVHIDHAMTSAAATKFLSRQSYDLILVDLMLGPSENGAKWVDTYQGAAFVVSMTSDRNLCTVIFSHRFDLVCSKGELYTLLQSR